MNIQKIFLIILSFIALCSCNKTEFNIEGEIKDAATMNLRIFYYSSSGNKGSITETVIPVVDGKFSYVGKSEKPTVVWFFSPNRALLTPIYVEPGDEIKIDGKYNEPLCWHVTGNKIEEEWSAWRSENEKSLKSGNDKVINQAISKYVEANRNNPVSALSMLCFYVKKDATKDYDKLWKLLSEDALSAELINAVNATKAHQSSQSHAVKLTPLSLYSYADSMTNIAVSKSKATLLYFWRQQEERHDSCISNIKRLHKLYSDSTKLQIADINMDTDTIKWRRQARRDSVKNWQRYWAIGGEANISLMPLELPRTPYFIVSDSTGTQCYRGDNYSKAEKKIKELLK